MIVTQYIDPDIAKHSWVHFRYIPIVRSCTKQFRVKNYGVVHFRDTHGEISTETPSIASAFFLRRSIVSPEPICSR